MIISKVEAFPALEISMRVEVNHNASRVLWSLRCDDGTKANGFARNRLEAIAKAVAFIEAIEKSSGATAGPTLVVDNGDAE